MMNRHLKLFLAMGIPYGVFMGAFYSLRYGNFRGVMPGITAGIFFGGFMTVVLGFMHSRSVKRMAFGQSEEAMGVHHVRNLQLQVGYDRAFDLCVESLSLLKKCKIQDEDRANGKIVARTGLNWKTWGDTISFELSRMGTDRVRVEIRTRPSVRTTLVDYGRNLENVETLSGFLNSQDETTV